MIFLFMGGGFQKITLMRGGGAMRKKSEIGGGGHTIIQFSNYTPPNPTSAPYPIKNDRSLKDKIQKSKESIAKLKKHIENNTCPKTLRYNARANIAPDEEFKRDISWIRKDAERKVLGALVKFHDRRV